MSDRNGALKALLAQRPAWANRIVLAGVCGSDSHGTKLPPEHPRHTDDVDTFGVSVQPTSWYLGLSGYHGSARQSWTTAGEHYDHLIHDVRKMFALLIKGNPNVHSWLWADPEDVLLCTPAGRLIVDNRRLFLSARCFAALAGYARAQLHKMDRKRYQGYQGAKRRAMVDELGYDVKHAAHCIRLLNMGIELARTGEMATRRPVAEAVTLTEIKAGEWPFRRTESLASDLWVRFQDAERSATLPPEPDAEAADALLLSVIEAADRAPTHEDLNEGREPRL